MHISTEGFITSLVFGSTLTRKFGVTMKDQSNMSDGKCCKVLAVRCKCKVGLHYVPTTQIIITIISHVNNVGGKRTSLLQTMWAHFCRNTPISNHTNINATNPFTLEPYTSTHSLMNPSRADTLHYSPSISTLYIVFTAVWLSLSIIQAVHKLSLKC